jgi:hypothetical protein
MDGIFFGIGIVTSFVGFIMLLAAFFNAADGAGQDGENDRSTIVILLFAVCLFLASLTSIAMAILIQLSG